MKYCPFCGATLMGGAVSFCSECGKPIPTASQTQTSESEDLQDSNLSNPDNQCKSSVGTDEKPYDKSKVKPVGKSLQNDKKKKPRKQKKPLKKEKHRNNDVFDHNIETDPQDDGYDGYYDDVRPLDNGHEKERMDPELIKKVIMVAGGAAIIIILAVVVMLVL